MAEDFDRPHDALKLALLLFANTVLFSQDDRNQVAYWMFSLVEEVQAFNNFAWGHYVFKMTLHYIRQARRRTRISSLIRKKYTVMLDWR
ncbi:hypothetical protein Q3G72_033644 [Acer saccharum]|nr:hypothetical protein Q3G72_033644 [Acer saccharum]